MCSDFYFWSIATGEKISHMLAGFQKTGVYVRKAQQLDKLIYTGDNGPWIGANSGFNPLALGAVSCVVGGFLFFFYNCLYYVCQQKCWVQIWFLFAKVFNTNYAYAGHTILDGYIFLHNISHGSHNCSK